MIDRKTKLLKDIIHDLETIRGWVRSHQLDPDALVNLTVNIQKDIELEISGDDPKCRHGVSMAQVCRECTPINHDIGRRVRQG